MLIVPIASLPNQTFDVLIDNTNEWEIAIYTVNDFNLMCADFILNGTLILSGQRCVPQQLLVPYRYLVEGAGNFLFVTVNDEYPDYTQFNLTQQLLYVSPEEIEVAIAANF